MIAIVVLVLLALAIGGVVAFVVARDPGYVLIAYDGATLETSVWFAMLCVLALVVGWFALAFVARRTVRAGTGLVAWAGGRRTGRAGAQAHRGAMLLAEGRWREAIDDLLASTAAGGTPLANYLGAARAANQLGRFDERDDILARAGRALPDAAFVAQLTRAELQQAAGQWHESVDTLTGLRAQAPRHPQLPKRLFDAYQALGDMEAVVALAPDLPAGTALDDVRFAAWRARLTTPGRDAGAISHARNTWRAMPRKLRDAEALVLAYVDVLVANGAEADAETTLRRALKKRWRVSWVLRYGTIGGDVAKRRATANAWLPNHADAAPLLLTLGRLALAEGDLPDARKHLLASLEVESTPATLAEVGRLCIAEGDHAAATGYLQRALGFQQAKR